MAKVSIPGLTMCKKCSNVAVSYNGLCIDCADKNDYLSGYSERPMPTRTMKNPFGMEIECIPKPGVDRSQIRIIEKFAATDASINDGIEYKIVADAKRIANRGACVAQRARMAGATVDRRCGIHVHMSKPIAYQTPYGRRSYYSLNTNEYLRLFKLTRSIEAEFMSMVPNSRRDNEYCRSVGRYDSLCDHHAWLSVSRTVPTIELRIHPGSLNPWKVKAWAEVSKHLQKLCHDVILEPEEDKWKDTTKKAITSGFVSSMPSGLGKQYVTARINNNGKLVKFGF